MNWKITYYNNKVQEAILKWPNKILARYQRIADLMQEDGPNLGMPFTRAVEKGLFEIRVKAHEGIARAFFCYRFKNQIVILHGYIKKTQQIPVKELKIAEKRLKEVMQYEL